MSSSILKADARALIKANAPKIILVGIVYLVVTTFITQLQSHLPAPANIYPQFHANEISAEQFFASFRPHGILLALLLGLMLPTISTGYNYYCLKITRAQDADYKDLLRGLNMFLKVIALSIVSSFFVMLWSFLFVIPGIIAIYRYRQAYFILLDDPTKGVLQCITESKYLMHGRKIDLFLIDLSFIGWNMLSLLVLLFIIPFFPIVRIWLAPYYTLVLANYYNQLIADTNNTDEADEVESHTTDGDV